MIRRIFFMALVFSFSLSLEAQNTDIDLLLEKVQKSQSKEERVILLDKLKIQLAQINKKTREESDAIIKAKKKLPTKLFKVK